MKGTGRGEARKLQKEIKELGQAICLSLAIAAEERKKKETGEGQGEPPRPHG